MSLLDDSWHDGRDMVSPENLGTMSLLLVFVVRAVFNTLREPAGAACKFLELRKFRETIGLEYFPSPLASWHMGLRTDAVIDKNKRTLLEAGSKDSKSYTLDAHKMKLSDDELGNGISVIRAILQLRPLNQFLPAGYIAEKCGMRYPSIPSMVERSEKLKIMADEVCPDGPKIDVNALEEVASLKFSEKDGKTYNGWEAYLRSIAAQYPDMPVVVDDLLAWEAIRPWMAKDTKGAVVISESHGWKYVPLRGKEAINACDETRVHGTQFNCLWSILAQGGLVGTYYNDAGIESHAVWTSELPTESAGYSYWMYIGSGFWVTVVIHIANSDVEASGCEVVRKLGSTKKQVAHKTPFLPICGVSFRVADFDRVCNKHGGKIVNFAYLSKEVKPGQWSDAHAWHSLFEVSPIDLKSFASRGLMLSSSQLSVQLKVGSSKAEDEEMEDDEQAPSAGARSAEAAPSATPVPVPQDAMWLPEYDLGQETSKPAGTYATLDEIGHDCCYLMLRPTFDKDPVNIAESGSRNMPRANPMNVLTQGFGEIWTRWSTTMRRILVRVTPGSIARYRTDQNGAFFTPEQVNDIRSRLGMREWTVHEVLCLLESLSPLLAIRVASTLAYGAVPPLFNPSVTNEIYLIHDGVLSGKSMSGGNTDPEMLGPYVSQAARDLRLGIFDCRVICGDPDLPTLEQLAAIAMKVVEDVTRRGAGRKSHIIIFWAFRDSCTCDNTWSRIESVISSEEASRGIDNALKTLETIKEVGNVTVVGPGNPVLYGYPASSPKYNELTTRFRVAWEVNASSGVISYPIELILSGCSMSRWGFLQKTKVNIGRVASRIAYLAAMSTMCGLGHCDMNVDEARAYINSRTPVSGDKPRLGVDVFSALTGDQSTGSALPPPPGHAPPPAPAAPQMS